MGLIRLLLAISVITTHSTSIFGLNFIQGQLAVEIFFMISGFYMALILTEKYNKKTDYKIFITNRLLKIFPAYWLILATSLIYRIIHFNIDPNSPDILGFFNQNYQLNIFSSLFLIIPNITIIGLDLGFFFRLGQNGSLFFTNNFQQYPPALYNFDLIVQAWTLSLELLFYFLAPFLNKFKNKNIIILMFLSLGLRFYLYSIGLNHDPWTYRFFPNEIIFFLAGILMYRLYQKIKIQKSKYLPTFLFTSYISYLIFYQFLPSGNTKQTVLFFLSFASLPFIFNLFKNNKLDRFIGELSFPVYICHFLIIDITTHLTKLPHQFLGLSTTIFSILISILILKFIINPIDNYRQSRVVLN